MSPIVEYCCLEHALCDAEISESAREAFLYYQSHPEIERWCGQSTGPSGSIVIETPTPTGATR